LSPRAAWRLEALSFTSVYDYAAGKADWGAFGLPLEGTLGSESRVGAHLRSDVPTCRPDELLNDVRKRLEGWNICLVVNAANVVLGLLGKASLGSAANTSAEEAMTPGPSTVRANLLLTAAQERMQREHLSILPVTRSDGVLLGGYVA
jgi:CBS domain-containing protein